MASQGKRMVPEALIKKLQDFSNNGLAALTAGNITTLTTNQINSLKCGDIVCKEDSTGKHAYIVSYKKDGTGICLTYADASVVETVSYDYSGSAWVYNSTDITNINTVVANPTLAGTEASLKGLQVGDTKYAMPHLYQVRAELTNNNIDYYDNYVEICFYTSIIPTSQNIMDLVKNNCINKFPIYTYQDGFIPTKTNSNAIPLCITYYNNNDTADIEFFYFSNNNLNFNITEIEDFSDNISVSLQEYIQIF